ncbi:MAG: hypothetical protein HQ581_19755 [Planctomycetes bacterium]|nr:hypothetical protein [Planctomycetota bacterium]
MLNWLFGGEESGDAGLDRMHSAFGRMLDAGRHVFDVTANAFLGGTDLEVIRQDVFKTDKRINKAERRIRREIVVHASVHGSSVFPECLVLMSLVKDAERVGDYGKNLFDLAELMPHPPSGEHLDVLIDLKDRISAEMATCREVFDVRKADQAARVICNVREIEDFCDQKVSDFIRQPDQTDMVAVYVLAYRYFKRVASHTRNITSSVIQPLHRLDFTSKVTVPGDLLNQEPEAEEES